MSKILDELNIDIRKVLDSNEMIYDVMKRSKKNLEGSPSDVRYLILKDEMTDYVIEKLSTEDYSTMDPLDKKRVQNYCFNLSKFLLNYYNTQFYDDPILELDDELLLKLFGESKLELIRKIKFKNRQEAFSIYKRYIDPETRIYVANQEFLKMIDFFTSSIISSRIDYDTYIKQIRLLELLLSDENSSKDLKVKNFIFQYILRNESRKRNKPLRLYLCGKFFENNLFDCLVRENVIGINSEYLINTNISEINPEIIARYEHMSIGYKTSNGMPFPKALQYFYSALYQIDNRDKQISPEKCEFAGWDGTAEFYKRYAPFAFERSKGKIKN